MGERTNLVNLKAADTDEALTEVSAPRSSARIVEMVSPPDDLEAAVFDSLDVAYSTYTTNRDDAGVSQAVVRKEWVAGGHDFSKKDEAKYRFSLGHAEDDDDTAHDMDPMKPLRDQERYDRMIPLDTACSLLAKRRLSFGLEEWKERVLIEGETALYLIPCVAFDGMPTAPKLKQAGFNAIMLTKLIEEEDVEERNREGYLTGAVTRMTRTTHRMHFMTREHAAVMEGMENYGVSSKIGSDETSVAGAYLSQHHARVTYAVLNIEGNLFHIHGEALDKARLMVSWAGGRRRDTCSNCCAMDQCCALDQCCNCLECSCKCWCYQGSYAWHEWTSRRDDMKQLAQVLKTRDRELHFDLHTIFPRLVKNKVAAVTGKEGELTETYHGIFLAFRDPSSLEVCTMVAYADPSWDFREVIAFISKAQRLTVKVDYAERNKKLVSISPNKSVKQVHGNFSTISTFFESKLHKTRSTLALSGVVGLILAIAFSSADQKTGGAFMVPSLLLEIITSLYKGLTGSQWYSPTKQVERTIDLYMQGFSALVFFINIILAAAFADPLLRTSGIIMALYSMGQGLGFNYSCKILLKLIKDADDATFLDVEAVTVMPPLTWFRPNAWK